MSFTSHCLAYYSNNVKAYHQDTNFDSRTSSIQWTRPLLMILNKTMLRAPGQLYGVSFYCDDPASTEVMLNGQSLILARHPADETGRGSVTVMEMEIKHSVFCMLDPQQRAPDDVVVNGSWNWQADGIVPYGQLSVLVDTRESLLIPTHGLHPSVRKVWRSADEVPGQWDLSRPVVMRLFSITATLNCALQVRRLLTFWLIIGR